MRTGFFRYRFTRHGCPFLSWLWIRLTTFSYCRSLETPQSRSPNVNCSILNPPVPSPTWSIPQVDPHTNPFDLLGIQLTIGRRAGVIFRQHLKFSIAYHGVLKLKSSPD